MNKKILTQMKNNKKKNLEDEENNISKNIHQDISSSKNLDINKFFYFKIIFCIILLLLYFLIKNNRKKIPTICLCLMGKRENLYVEEYINYYKKLG